MLMDDNKASSIIQWSATEGANQKRRTAWYLTAAGIVVALAGAAFAIWWFTGEWQFWTTVGLAVLALITLVFVNTRPGHVVSYALDDDGVVVDDKRYPYSAFRAFTIDNDSKNWQAILIPVRRLSLGISFVIPDGQGETIVDQLGAYLPMENTAPDIADRIARQLKL
ncbi:hypothetical protein FACS189431_2380 [Alphaproteobacteria bacterium]|nr:hypothetical protein FACS189431_2380 [Alphaproteobacteria bacterium]